MKRVNQPGEEGCAGTTHFSESVYTIPVSDKWLVYAPLQGRSALVNRTSVELIQGADRRGREVTEALPEIADWLLEAPRLPAALFDDEPCPSLLVIVPTRACNMKCVYCDFGGHEAAHGLLDLKRAFSAVDYVLELARRHGEPCLRVHFFGGEPFVAGDVTDAIVHYVRAQCGRLGIRPWLEVSTNGQFDATRAAFVGDYFDTVVLSFDGEPAFQDRNRPNPDGTGNSKEVMESIRALSATRTELCIRVCITNENAARMKDIAEFLCSSFDIDIIDFEVLAENALSEAAGLQTPNPFAFARGYVAATRMAHAHGVRVVTGALDTLEPRCSFCPMGTDALMLMPNGHITACYLTPGQWECHGMDLTFGETSPSGGVTLDFEKVKAVRELVRQKPRCERCFCRWSCGGGCHVHHSPPGSSMDYDDFCVQIRVLTAWRLLEELGCGDLAEELLQDESSMEYLAFHADDRLSAWRKP